MKTELITSLQNPSVKKWRMLNRHRSERIAQGLFLAEGEHMVQEAVQNKWAKSILVAQSAQEKYSIFLQSNLPVYLLSDHVFSALCDAKTPQGILALCTYPKERDLSCLGQRIVCLNGVQDPGNVGTILRTMDAAGFTGLLMDEKTSDPTSPKVLRATMGSIFRIPFMQTNNLVNALDHLIEQNFEVVAGDLMGMPFFEERMRKKNTCIIIGNEGAGISTEIKDKATLRLKIPMIGGAESLNAAVAAAIMMYDDVRYRLTHP